ncbi:hypothetical protein NN484_24235 [Pseudomonas serboccidentalis]|uniref:Uncharacterized protein n=1 Tax=Pseudomonas serboccidentalis TaxID=2964670 RepID=A0ABY7Z7B9_9PSED|nr:hypothetical protein [Pseudomonas serboccidentalis]WDR35566.1 hypothetical protein NN484_24235 [Pseudomonas serboccidentalis]
MSTIHDQAMNYVYQQVLQRLLSFFSRAERTALQLLIQRLVVAAGGMERIGDYKVLVTPSGTRDSCYTLALLRAAQLSIAGRAPGTFQLRVATLRWGGTGAATLDNLHRSFGALFLYDDPRVELLMVDHRQVLPFNHLAPLDMESADANRTNLLMMGHRRAREETLELWDDASLAWAEFYGQIARWGNGVDAWVASESPRRQKAFMDELDCAVQKAGLGAMPSNGGTFDELFALLDGLGGDLYRGFYSESERLCWRPEDEFEACRRTTFVDIHDMVVGNLEERWALLSEFLGFQGEEWLLPLGEGEYADPLIDAHLSGLEAEFVGGRSYEAGFSEHVRRTLANMRRKGVPESVCEQMVLKPGQQQTLDELRETAANCLQKAYGLNEAQWVCLLFTPFIEHGAGLERFLRSCHPGMLVAMPDLHRAMQGLHGPEQVLQWMTDVSGLPVRLIARLYAMEPLPKRGGAVQAIDATLDAVALAETGSGVGDALWLAPQE